MEFIKYKISPEISMNIYQILMSLILVLLMIYIYFASLDPNKVPFEKLTYIQIIKISLPILELSISNAENPGTLDMMDYDLYSKVEQIVNNYIARTDDNHTHTFKFNVQNGEKKWRWC